MGSSKLPRGVTRIGPSRNFPKGGYEAAYRAPDGKERTKRTARLIDATQWLDAQRGDIVHGTHVDPNAGRQRFLAFADEWAAAQQWKGTTRDSWPPIRRRLERLFGSRSLSSIDLLALQTARKKLAETYARSTADQTMSWATMILRAAHVNGRLAKDPTRAYKAPRVRADEDDGTVGPDDLPTRVEALAILEGAPPQYRAAIALGLAGLRVGEVLGLSEDRIELDRRQVTVDRQLQRVGGQMILTTPKAEKVRTIVVPGLVALELRRHLRDHHNGTELLFTGRRGVERMRRDQFYASAWRPALKGAATILDAGLPEGESSGMTEDRFVFHSLRHFCASSLLAEGAPLTAVAGHLGDTVETVSRTYVHWLRDDRDVPAAVLDRVLAPVEARTVAL